MVDKNRQGGEVEITDDMIEAGADALRGFNPDWDSADQWVSAIFNAMWIASSRHQPMPRSFSTKPRDHS